MLQVSMTMRLREFEALSIGQCFLKYTYFKTRILLEISNINFLNCGNIQMLVCFLFFYFFAVLKGLFLKF